MDHLDLHRPKSSMSPPVAWISMDTESLKSGFSEVSNRSRRIIGGNGNGLNGGTGGSVVSLSLPGRHHQKNNQQRSHRLVPFLFLPHNSPFHFPSHTYGPFIRMRMSRSLCFPWPLPSVFSILDLDISQDSRYTTVVFYVHRVDVHRYVCTT